MIAAAHAEEDIPRGDAVPGDAEWAERQAEAEVELAVFPPLRRDLVIHRAHFRRRPSYVIKDPVSLKYFRLGAREFEALRHCDGRRRAFEIAEEVRRLHPEEEFGVRDLFNIVNSVTNLGLLDLDPSGARRLHATLKHSMKEAKRKTRLKRILGNLFFLKIPLFDPDLLLLRMDKKLGFLWRKPALVVLLVLLAVAMVLVISNASLFAERVPDIFTWQNGLIIWFFLIAIKVVHEFGHGLSCKHYGGEVHEMGALFILFSPFLYCNASDSWIFPHKWQRLVVNFAGIYLEMFLAATAAIVWVLTPPGLIHLIAFDIMLIASITTVVFNANPLMKFDGYYALSDTVEVPNLKERADRHLVGRISSFLIGPEAAVHDPVGQSFKMLIVYAVASYLWTFVICYAILKALAVLLEPYGLHRLAGSAALLVLGAGIFLPFFMVAKRIRQVLAAAADPGPMRKRLWFSLGGAALCLVVFFIVPVPQRVSTAVVLDGSNRVPLTAATAGFIEEVLPAGTIRVSEGALVARLSNLDALSRLTAAQADYDIRRIVLADAMARGDSGRLGAAVTDAEAAQTVFEQAQREHAQLELRAPFEAIVLNQNLADLRGRFVEKGGKICELLPVGEMAAVVALDERSASLVEIGQPVTFRLHAMPGRAFTGTVARTSRRNVSALPHASLSAAAGGTVAAPSEQVAAPPGRNAPPLNPSYRAEIILDNADGFLRPGMSGRARIDTGWTNLGAMIWEKLTRIVRTEFRF